MIRGVQYSRPAAIGAAAAAVAVGAVTWQHHALGARILEQRARAAAVEERLNGEIAANSMYESDRLTALRDQVGRSRIRLGDAATWGRIAGRFGEGWTLETGAIDEKGDHSIQYGTIRLPSPSVADWPKIVEAVTDLEAIPGVGIAEFEMTSSGGRDRRSMDLVRILVAVHTRRTGSKPPSAQ
jgi:hypothetical protein